MYSTKAGNPDKLGVTFTAAGANFCVYGRLAESVELLFFDHKDSKTASQIFRLHDIDNRTAYY